MNATLHLDCFNVDQFHAVRMRIDLHKAFDHILSIVRTNLN